MDGDIPPRAAVSDGPRDRWAELDAARAIELDPAIWTRNLDALATRDGALAARLRHTALPMHWRAVRALDGAPTYRVERLGQPPQWLSGTAAPRTRAEALLADMAGESVNVALSSIGAGADLGYLLERLPRRVAVFVFEADECALAAALRCVDASAAIRDLRCILVSSDDEAASLAQALDNHPGLLPPARIVRLPDLSSDRLAQVQTVCEQAARRVADRDRQRSAAFATGETLRTPAPSKPIAGLVVWSMTPDPRRAAAARALVAAADRMGWRTLSCVLDGPETVNPIWQCSRWAGSDAGLTILIGAARRSLPCDPPGVVCRWFPSVDEVPDEPLDRDSLLLGATPAVCARLRQRAAEPRDVIEFYWACGPAAEPITATLERRTVILLADLPDDRAEACGIEQPTHRLVWQELLKLAAADPHGAQRTRTDVLLARAERSAAVTVRDEALRRQFLRLIDGAVLPSRRARAVAAELRSPMVEVAVIGRGWEECPVDGVTLLARDVCELAPGVLPDRPLAAVLLAQDPLCPALLHAGAHGWPLLVFEPQPENLSAALGGVVSPGEHVQLISDLRGLGSAVRSSGSPEALERARRCRRHLHDYHQYTTRLAQLDAAIRSRGSGPECSS
jgi:hypothetical protein